MSAPDPAPEYNQGGSLWVAPLGSDDFTRVGTVESVGFATTPVEDLAPGEAVLTFPKAGFYKIALVFSRTAVSQVALDVWREMGGPCRSSARVWARRVKITKRREQRKQQARRNPRPVPHARGYHAKTRNRRSRS